MDEVAEEVDEDEAAAEENVDEDEAAAEEVEDAKAGGQQTIVLHEGTQFPPGVWLSFCRFSACRWSRALPGTPGSHDHLTHRGGNTLGK